MTEHNVITAQTFIETLFQDIPEDQTICLAKAVTRGESSWYDQKAPSERVYRAIARQPAPWYVCISSVDGETSEHGNLRRTKGNLKETYCIVLDDIGTKADTPPVEPSWRLESSPGNEQWGYLLDPTSDISAVEALIDALAAAGYTDVGAKGANRVVRFPGSWNLKTTLAEPFESRVLDWHPDRSWSLAELTTAFNVVPSSALAPALAAVGEAARRATMQTAMLDWLRARGEALNEPNSEGFTDVLCPNHASHTDGQLTGRWNAITGAYMCFHAGCANLDTEAYNQRMAAEGAPVVVRSSYVLPQLSVDQMVERFVHLSQDNRVFDLEDYSSIMKLPEFKARWAASQTWVEPEGNGRGRFVKHADQWLTDARRQSASGEGFYPADTPFFHDDAGSVRVNTYRARKLPSGGDAGLFRSHMDYLLPVEEERAYALDWMAHMVQHPAQRPHTGLLMVTPQTGTGRSILGTILSSMLGQGLSWRVDINKVIAREFNRFMYRSLLAVFDEVYSDFKHRTDATNTLRSMITEPQISVNIKHVSEFTANTFTRFLMFSNHWDALLLDKADRRIAVMQNPEEKADQTHYDAITAVMDNPRFLGGVRDWLGQRDLGNFNACAKAPEFAGRKNVVSMSLSEDAGVVQYLVEHWKSDVLTVQHLSALAVGHAGNDFNSRAVPAVLRQLGCVALEKRVKLDGKVATAWAVRDVQKWSAATGRDVSAEIKRGVTSTSNVVTGQFLQT